MRQHYLPDTSNVHTDLYVHIFMILFFLLKISNKYILTFLKLLQQCKLFKQDHVPEKHLQDGCITVVPTKLTDRKK